MLWPAIKLCLDDLIQYDCMITHDSMSLGSALRATSPTEAACYNRSTLPHVSSTYHLEHLTRVKFVKVEAIKNRVPFTDGPIESYRYLQIRVPTGLDGAMMYVVRFLWFHDWLCLWLIAD